METYNDWGYCGQDCRADQNGEPSNGCTNPNGTYVCKQYCPNCAFNGADVFSYLSPNGTTPMYFWYYREVAFGPSGSASVTYPDVILANALDSATLGNPGIGVTDRCISTSPLYQHFRGMGFYNDPVPNGRSPQGGIFVPPPPSTGTWEGRTNDGIEARGWAPRFARNEYGYLVPISSSPKKWATYLYYNDSQVRTNGSSCNVHVNMFSGARLSASYVEITEQ